MNNILLIICIIIFVIILAIVLIYSMKKSNFTKTQKIPKIIWQVAKNKSMSNLFKKHIEKLKKQNPDYKYKIIYDNDAQQLILKHYGDKMLQIFNSINSSYGSVKGDLLRYLIIYKFGGVYFDLKSGSKKSLSKIIKPNDEFLLSSWKQNFNENLLNTGFGEYQQWWIISIPKHVFLKNIIDSVVYNIINYNERLIGRYGVLYLSGPILYTRVIQNQINKGNIEYRFIPDNFSNNFLYDTFEDSGNYSTNHIKLLNGKHYSLSTNKIIDKNKLHNL